MADFAVLTKFKAKDLISAALGKMGNNTDKFGRKSQKNFKKASKSASQYGSVLKGILTANVLNRGFNLIGQGIRTTTTEFLDFDSAVGKAAARFQIDRTSKDFLELQTAIRKVGGTTEFTNAQVAKGLDEYAKAGIDAATAMKLLAGTAQLATNASVEFADAASISLDALDSFNLRSKNSEVTARNLKNVNDILTRTVTSAKLEFTDFAETLKFAGPVAEATGAKLQDMATLTGLVAKAGIRGSLAGTTLKSTYLGLAAPVGKGKTALKKLNVQIVDSSGNMRDALDILIDFKNRTKDMGNAQRFATTEAVFGRRAIAGVSKILSLGEKDLTDYRDRLRDSAGAAKNMASAIRQSLTNRLLVLKSSLIEVGFKILDAFGGKGSKLLDQFIEAVQNFDPTPLINGLKTAANWFEKGIKFIVKYKDEIIAIAAGLAAAGIAGKVLEIVTSLKSMDKRTTLIIAGISALVAFVVKFRKELEPTITAIKSGFQPTLDAIIDTVDILSKAFNGTGFSLSGLVSWISQATAWYVKFQVKFNPIIVGIRLMIKGVGLLVKTLMVLKEWMRPVWEPVANWFVNTFAPAVGSVFDWIGNKIKTFIDFLGKSVGMLSPVLNMVESISDKIGLSDAINIVENGEQKMFTPLPDNRFFGEQPTTSEFKDPLSGIFEPQTSSFKNELSSLDTLKSEPEKIDINLNLTGVPDGMTATAETKSKKAPVVRTSLAGAAA